ncbi:sugar specific permease [Weissella oryzae SG25]|uniref:Sugar specific permease n=1 Tax=Weissella oryzae (strain DSM 25784 / JCM 18191 / LMG 30913 / SG25) TaxID=1329250 RepID=A0A069CYI5_WEIOS|nr:hypothetical protein [Weissella oryzae]GAK30156.1 sugar specific permease [Weissella oryzae SG25]
MLNHKALDRSNTMSLGHSIYYFILSLLLNSFGNVLTIVTSQKMHPSILGSAYWTATQSGFNKAVFNGSTSMLGWTFFGFGVLTALLNVILQGHFDWKNFFGNLAFMVPFSMLISFFATEFSGLFPDVHNLLGGASYTLLNFIGVFFIAVAISIYQRVNLVLHPADDLMQILRFKYFKGNAIIAMWVSYIPPTIIGLIAIIIYPDFTNYGLGTIFAFIFQGGITGWADSHIIPSLKHQRIN